MDKKSALRNITVSISFKVVIMILNVFLLKSLDLIGETYTGYHSLFHSIISVVNLTECGFAGGVAFCLYKSIVNNDEKRIIALYSFLRKCYFVIFFIVTILGLSITPFLPFLNKDISAGSSFDASVYLAYSFYVLSTSITYLYSYKSTIICAYKNNYKKDIAVSVGTASQFIVQIAIAYIFKNFLVFAICSIIGTAIQGILINVIFKKDHKFLIKQSASLEKEEKKNVLKYVFSSFAHHVGDVLVYSTDSIIISSLVGATSLAGYYRYLSIANAIFTVSSLLFTSLTSVVGHSFENNTKEKMLSLFKKSYFIGFLVGSILYLGFYGGADYFVGYVYGYDKVINFLIPISMSFCFFVRFMQKPCLLFRDASGAFSKDWYKPIIECVLNLALDFLLVYFFGVIGVVIATIIVLLLISHVLEPLNLFKYSFQKSPAKYYLINYLCLLTFGIEIGVVWIIRKALSSIQYNLFGFLLFGTISVLVAILFSIIVETLMKTGFIKTLFNRFGIVETPKPSKIASIIGFKALFIGIVLLSSLCAVGTNDYKLDRFSYELIDYTKINYSNNLHPTIMNIHSNEEDSSYDAAFSYFYYNLNANASRIVVDNNTQININSKVSNIKMICQNSFSIRDKLPNESGYYLDYGQYSTYFKNELLPKTNSIRNGADTFVFISDKLADYLLNEYGLDSYNELIIDEHYCNLPIVIDEEHQKQGCINNILYTSTRKADRTIDAYGDYFVLFYNTSSIKKNIDLSLDIELKTNPYSIKKCFSNLKQFGYSVDNSKITFLTYNEQQGFYFDKNDITSNLLSQKYANCYKRSSDWYFYLLYFCSISLFIPYYFLERKLFGEAKRLIFGRIALICILGIAYSIFASFYYSYTLWGVSLLFSAVMLFVFYSKRLIAPLNHKQGVSGIDYYEVKI